MIARTQASLILFDGVCNLCKTWVRHFQLRHARDACYASCFAIDASGSDELKPARIHRQTSGQNSSNDPGGTQTSTCHVLTERH
jgi:predicted DCC family thiol-disulfide oxidoreductase YuxK